MQIKPVALVIGTNKGIGDQIPKDLVVSQGQTSHTEEDIVT